MDTPNNRPAETSRVQLARADRIVLFCVLCGHDIGPHPVQAVVMVPNGPASTELGYCCGDCLRLHPLALADAIDDHVEWLAGTVTELRRLSDLARSGQLERPSVLEWQVANQRLEGSL